MTLLEHLLHWDQQLFRVINSRWTNTFFDNLMPLLRNQFVWMPFYIFFLAFAAINFGKRGFLWILFAVLTVATSDLISSWGVKELIFRSRPCRDLTLQIPVRLIVPYCPMSSGFTSSHATNHFAMAMFIFMTLHSVLGKWLRWIFFWAFIICYAQVYVGVHYPLDVLGGALLGMAIGYFWGRFFQHHYPFKETIPS